MPSTSPGNVAPKTPSDFVQLLPGAPTSSLQAVTTFVFRQKRYFAYISGRQLTLLASSTKLVQAIAFQEELVALSSNALTGRLAVAGKSAVYTLDPVTEGWTKIWWEKSLSLRRGDASDEARCLSWGNEGEILVGGSRQLSLFSTLPSSRTSSPAASPIVDEVAEDRKALWSKDVASPVQYASFSPSASLIATCGVYDRLVKIWRRLSFEEGLFDHTYLPHPGTVTHLEWRPLIERLEERRGSGISSRSEEDPEVLYTIANDGVVRVWRAGGMQDMNILILHTTVDLVSSIPQSPTLSAKSRTNVLKPSRYAFIVSAAQFRTAVTAAINNPSTNGPSHSSEHLKEVLSKSPDVIVTVDGHGRMSAWGLQSVGHLRRPETPGSKAPFHIAHSEGLRLRITGEANARTCIWFENDAIQAVCHDFNGEIRWWQGDVETFFSTAAPGSARLQEVALLSGHDCAVESLSERSTTAGLVSKDCSGKEMWWKRDSKGMLRRDVFTAPTSRDSGLDQTNGTKVSYTLANGRRPSSTPLPLAQPSLRLVDSEAGLSVEVRSVTAPYAHENSVMRSIETSLHGHSCAASNSEIVAVVSADRKDLVIVDLQDGYVEHHQQVHGQSIRSMECFAAVPGCNVLAIAYKDYIEVLAQGRHMNGDNPTWTVVKCVSIAGTGLEVNSIAWLSDGALAIAAGNGIVLSSSDVSTAQLSAHLRQMADVDFTQHHRTLLPELSAMLKQPLPIWHPRNIIHLVHHGKERRASALISRLADKLKFWSEGDDLHALIDPPDDSILGSSKVSAEQSPSLGGDLVKELQAQLDEKALPAVTDMEQKHLKKVITALVYLSEHKTGLDHCALRYLFVWKLQLLEFTDAEQEPPISQPNGATHPKQPPVSVMHWREIAFASHSTTQQPLLDILVLHYDNKLTWPIARSLGITAWLSDREALTTVFESLAQSAYRETSPPDPTNASLYFIALHKKSTLLALWRIATWHKEQRATTNFLKRDFNQADARTAAKKNAYALMGKRRFEYAAAFFLLADDAASATSLLAGQCGDIMLAIAVARLHDGDGSPTLQKLLNDRLFPKARQEGDRWLMSWCHSLLLQGTDAARCLVGPLSGVRYWHQDDPTTLMLYRHLRKETSEHEYEAVLRGARVLRKMGLWLLALDLVAEWKFEAPKAPAPPISAAANDMASEAPPSMLDGFDAPPPAGITTQPSMLNAFGDGASPPPVLDEKAAREAKAAELLAKLRAKKQETSSVPASVVSEKKKPEPTQFKEPDANSLLDSFGF